MGIPGVPPPFFFGFELRGNTGYYYLILALDVLTLFVLSRIVTSRLGRAFVSIREDELAAQASGIPTFRPQGALVRGRDVLRRLCAAHSSPTTPAS